MKMTNNNININRDLFPYCIVWSPLPVITWFLPFIGHTGIGSSDGTIYDFAGPYTIGKGRFAFGSPTKYLILDPSKCRDTSWDRGVEEGCTIYSQRMHNICCDNCHSHVATCLNIMGYDNRRNYGMIDIGVMMFFHGTFTESSAILKTFGPFCTLLAIILLIYFFA